MSESSAGTEVSIVDKFENRRDEIVVKLKGYLKNRVSEQQATLLEEFAKRYYNSSSLADLNERSMEDLLGAFLSHWNFVYEREAGESKVRIFNPSLEKDGWESTHTIIEISHDDIPFLVDSTRMEINRNGLQIHFIIHFGGLKLLRDDHHRITKVIPIGENDPKATTEAPIYIEN